MKDVHQSKVSQIIPIFCSVLSKLCSGIHFYYSEEKVDSDGEFECPLDDTKKLDKNGQTVDHPRFEHPTDCQKFFVCLNGVEKRALVCEDGQVFNINKGACDAPENVPEW